MRFSVSTKGHYDFINITDQVLGIVAESGVKDGVAVVFAAHTTVAVTIVEWEEGIKQDIKRVLEAIAPEHGDYAHHKRWHDHNGAAHIKSAIVGPSLSVPIENGELVLGTWQQIALIDFDEKPRERGVMVKIVKS